MSLYRAGAFCSCVFLFFASSVLNAATLNVSLQGVLTGADGVIINGNEYNVSFVEGPCADVFSGCDDSSDFFFQTKSEGLAAGQALLDQVFLDGIAGNFDADITKTFGCDQATTVCVAMVTYQNGLLSDPDSGGLSDVLIFARNFDSSGSDNRGAVTYQNVGGLIELDSSINPGGNPNFNGDVQVWAVFSNTAVVPVPAAVWLFSSGLLGLIGIARRKKPA